MKQRAEHSYGRSTILLALIAVISILSFEIMPDDLYMATWYGADEGAPIQRLADGDDRLNSKVIAANVIAQAVSMSSRTKEVTIEKDKGESSSLIALRLSPTEWRKVSRLLKEWDMTIEEFCQYSVKQIAAAHQSKRFSSNIPKSNI